MSKLKKALEKAKEAREQVGESPVWEEASSSGNAQVAVSGELERCDINPTYHCTKVF